MRDRRRIPAFAVALTSVVLGATVCSSGGSSNTVPPDEPTAVSSPTAVTTGSAALDPVWLAVFDTAADPNELDAATGELLPLVGGAIVVSPASCFQGLPGDVRSADYVIGVVAGTLAELDDVVAAAERTPTFTGEVGQLCLD